ncbi:MAG: glutamine-hydrolyzing GMP synthase [Euryarchaeota archaeon]|nr:glutamine-hydrolyzing GMP synthase [Euryarchaeota archaeon]
MAENKILIIDFGSQYTQLIARRVRELGVLSMVVSLEDFPNYPDRDQLLGVILSGGPDSVYHSKHHVKHILELNIPVLGICYGMHILVKSLGGRVSKSDIREYGKTGVDIDTTSVLFKGVKQKQIGKYIDVWMSHGDSVTDVPAGMKVIAHNDSTPVVAFELVTRIFGLQFHPEVTHTDQGRKIISNFLFHVCGAKKSWTVKRIEKDLINDIRNTVGDKKVILGLSGGVDSSVSAVLIHRAIGAQLKCVFVDTGLLRLNEKEDVENLFVKNLNIKVDFVNARRKFFDALANQDDPERKRKIVGRCFVEVFQHHIRKNANYDFLAQGTIYPDVIESAVNSKSKTIKSHHNVGGLPKDLKFKLLEPLRILFKDEVRKLGTSMGIPRSIIQRHPFPGPGLGVRILGEVNRKNASILQKADHVFIDELVRSGQYDMVSQAFCVLLPVKSVGVMGDKRTYENVICVRSVNTIDFMTAKISKFKFEFLEKVANRIVNEVDGVNRVAYDITSKPPATIEWE